MGHQFLFYLIHIFTEFAHAQTVFPNRTPTFRHKKAFSAIL